MTLAQGLIDAGLIQFGWFRQNGETVPVSLHLDMLGSYPDLLEAAAREAQTAAAAGIDANRLLCAADALPFGVAFSLHSRVPLVYRRGSADAPVYDLVGAYDIGHPALLLANSVGFGDDYQALIGMARRVGLETHTLLTIVERRQPQVDGIAVLPLLRLADVVYELGNTGYLTAGHVRAVLDWCGGTG